MNVDRPTAALRWLARNVEFSSLLFIALAVLPLWAFVELADEVFEGATRDIDRDILLLLRAPGDLADPLGPPWLEEMARDVTALGGVFVLTLLTLVAAGFFLLRGRTRSMLYLLVATGGGILISQAAKGLFDRPRPDLVPHDALVSTASFPSGHSMMAAVAYLTLGALIAHALPHWRLKIYVLSVAALVMILVGLSRVYLGVHWPTDVLAGWLAGVAWAALCLLGANLLALRDGSSRPFGGDRAP